MFFLSETAWDSHTESRCSCNVSKEFSSLVDKATVQHRPTPTGLTHLGLTVLWRSLEDAALLSSSSRNETLDWLPFNPPTHFSYSCSPKKDAEKPKTKWCSNFMSCFGFFLNSNSKSLVLEVISFHNHSERYSITHGH